MIHLISSIVVYRPIKQVFDFISTAENDSLWQYGTLMSARISKGAGEGAFFRSIGHLMGRRVQGTYEVTEYEANKRYGFKSLTGPLDVETHYTFEIERGCTKVNVSTQASVNDFQVPEGVLQKQLKKQTRENLTMLKGLLETPQAQGVPARG